MITLDGAYGEGGGALLRTALALSALTQQTLRIESIRGATSHPGLDLEDLTIIQVLKQACAADVVGGEPGSANLTFLPTKRPKGIRDVLNLERPDQRRWPNALVVLNALVPVLARSGMYSQVAVHGETYGNHALTFDYFQGVTARVLGVMGMGVFPELVSAGFGREQGGRVDLDIEPSTVEGLNWPERGKHVQSTIRIVTSGIPGSIAHRGMSHARNLGQSVGIKFVEEINDLEAAGPGVFVTVYGEWAKGAAGSTAMGSRGVRVEALVQRAVEEYFEWHKSDATVDPYLADQILIPAAIAESPSAFKVPVLTERFLTCVWAVKQFLPIHITIRGKVGEPGTISIRR